MSEKKTLNEEELNKVAGGTSGSEAPAITFKYEKGYETEICDHKGFFATYTHHAVITKRGYFYCFDTFCYMACYYFEGHKDVDGWYPESLVDKLPEENVADTKFRMKTAEGITLVD